MLGLSRVCNAMREENKERERERESFIVVRLLTKPTPLFFTTREGLHYIPLIVQSPLQQAPLITKPGSLVVVGFSTSSKFTPPLSTSLVEMVE